MRFSVWRGPVREKLLLSEHITKTLFDIYQSFVGPRGNLLRLFCLFVFLRARLLFGKACKSDTLQSSAGLSTYLPATHLPIPPFVYARILLHRIGEAIISIMLLGR